jgi:integrase
VYVIWYISKKDKRKTLRVGQAKVLRERLAANRGDEDIKDHATRHTLYVTWAHVGADQHDGVEAYLGQALSPKAGRALPGRGPNRS